MKTFFAGLICAGSGAGGICFVCAAMKLLSNENMRTARKMNIAILRFIYSSMHIRCVREALAFVDAGSLYRRTATRAAVDFRKVTSSPSSRFGEDGECRRLPQRIRRSTKGNRCGSAGAAVGGICRRGCVQVNMKTLCRIGSWRIAVSVAAVIRASPGHVLALRRLGELPDFGKVDATVRRGWRTATESSIRARAGRRR